MKMEDGEIGRKFSRLSREGFGKDEKSKIASGTHCKHPSLE